MSIASRASSLARRVTRPLRTGAGVSTLAALSVLSVLAGCAAPATVSWTSAQDAQPTAVAGVSAQGQSWQPGVVSEVSSTTQWVYEKTATCRMEPKALHAVSAWRIGRWVVRHTSTCYTEIPGQIITVRLDSGAQHRVRLWQHPAFTPGERVWLKADSLRKMTPEGGMVPPVAGAIPQDARVCEKPAAAPAPAVVATPAAAIAAPVADDAAQVAGTVTPAGAVVPPPEPSSSAAPAPTSAVQAPQNHEPACPVAECSAAPAK